MVLSVEIKDKELEEKITKLRKSGVNITEFIAKLIKGCVIC